MPMRYALLSIDFTATESWLAITLITGLVGACIYFIKKYLDRIDKGEETKILFGKVDKILGEITDMKIHAAALTVTVNNTNSLVHEMKREYIDITKRVHDVELGCSDNHAAEIKKGGKHGRI